jgi:hypothetical protein
VAHLLLQKLRVPHPFASFAKGWALALSNRAEPKPSASVESHPCAKYAQGWGTQHPDSSTAGNTRSLDFARDDRVVRLVQGAPLQLVRKDDSLALAVYAPVAG